MDFVGKKIIGKWNKKVYKPLALIGEGGIGKVYRVVDESTSREYALKISSEIQSITKESELLEKFCEFDFFPKLHDTDDFIFMGKPYYFLVMDLIEGYNLNEYFNKINDIKEILGVVIILGRYIEKLHKKGYILGDLKLENVMVDRKNNKLMIVDLGGITPLNRGIVEYTPIYDRSRWSLGLRRADEKYDLFSLAILMVYLLIKDKNKIKGMSVQEIIKELKKHNINNNLIDVLKDGLYQRCTFSDFIKKLKELYKKPLNFINYKRINTIVNLYFALSVFTLFIVSLIIILKN